MRLRHATAIGALALLLTLATVVPAGAGGVLSAEAAPIAARTTSSESSTSGTSTTTETTSTDQPLIIVLDLSTSMDDSDGSGGVKLSGAKAAVERAVRARGVGSTVGIWGYPNDEDCSAGGFVVPPTKLTAAPTSVTGSQSYDDIAGVLARVDALTTRAGGTPIGVALRTTSESLVLKGFTRATMLLVTDGMNTCEPDPCEEARAVQRNGFDLTVDAIGFDTEDEANETLNCIADATGGTFTDAANGEDLQRELESLAVSHLTMELTYAKVVRAGSSPAIDISITNPSTTDAVDVRANLAFHRATATGLMPAVVPPTYRIGNVPAGGSVSREWVLSTAPKDAGRIGSFTATLWDGDGGTAQQDGTISVTDQQISPEGRLFKNLDEFPLVILGDSFSAGEGGEAYEKAPKNADERCHRTRNTYLANRMNAGSVLVIACSGAVTDNWDNDQFTEDGDWRADPQEWQLEHLDKAPGAVVFTFGGNDAGFADIIKECVAHHLATDGGPGGVLISGVGMKFWNPNCSASTEAGQTRLTAIAALQTTLPQLYKKIWETANSPAFVEQRHGAYAPVIVSTYQQEFKPAQYGACSAVFTAEGADYGNKLATALMAVAKESVSRVVDEGYEVYFAPTPLNAFLPDHTYCEDDDSKIDVRRLLTPKPDAGDIPASFFTSQESMHPNKNGYADTTDALIEWQSTIERFSPSSQAKSAAVGVDLNWLQRMIASYLDLPSAPVTVTPGTQGELETSSVSTITAEGFSPFTTVSFTLHSTPILLGTVRTDAGGVARLRTHLPAITEMGRHELTASGTDKTGAAREVTMPVVVKEPVPVWLVAALILAVGLVLVCLVVLVRGRLRDRRAARDGART